MSQSRESKNKALVLKAFDTLFNQRDYAAAERFCSPNYIQHSAHIEPGREGLFNLIKGLGAQIRARRHRGGGGLRHHPWTVLWKWAPSELDCRRRCAHCRRCPG